MREIRPKRGKPEPSPTKGIFTLRRFFSLEEGGGRLLCDRPLGRGGEKRIRKVGLGHYGVLPYPRGLLRIISAFYSRFLARYPITESVRSSRYGECMAGLLWRPVFSFPSGLFHSPSLISILLLLSAYRAGCGQRQRHARTLLAMGWINGAGWPTVLPIDSRPSRPPDGRVGWLALWPCTVPNRRRCAERAFPLAGYCCEIQR